MTGTREFNIVKGHNYRILEARGFDSIVFGCPPGMVKDFARNDRPLPRHYVIPIRTFIKGKNNFDFEFIIYSFLFFKKRKLKISVYCSRDQKTRFKNILNETLFGPRFRYLLQAQFRKFCVRKKFSPRDLERFDTFLSRMAADKKLFNRFSHLLKIHAGDPAITRTIREYFEELIQGERWLKQKKIPRLAGDLAHHYIICAQLKKEMDLFSLADEKGRDRFLNNLIDFYELDLDKSVTVPGKKDKRKKIKIVQRRPSAFEIISKNKKLGSIDISHLDPPEFLDDFQLVEKPFMGVTFLGVGSGFTPKRRNSCLIAWSEGKGIMVDAVSDSSRVALNHGITENDILYIFLTHVHSDHDAGLAELILSGQRIKVISSRIIFESFLRKLEALTCLPIRIVEEFIDFLEVEPHKKIRLPGFDHTYFEFDYSLHSIPTGRFRLIYKDPTGKQTVISHSGDTKYDVENIHQWYREGIFSRKRRDEVLGFIWDADLILHDVGGGFLHTRLESLESLDESVKEKLVLVHQHQDPKPHPEFHFGAEGQTRVLIRPPRVAPSADVDTIKKVALFKALKKQDLLAMLHNSEVVLFQADEIVFSQNDLGDDFYVILEGFAEIIIDGRAFAIYEKGKLFGELAVSTGDPRRRATIKAKSPLTLLRIPSGLYHKFNLPKVHDNFYNMRNYFSEAVHPSLIASLAFGKIIHWSQKDCILSRNSDPREVHIILSGQVAITHRDSNDSVFLSRGDVIGKTGEMKTLRGHVSAWAHTEDVYTIRMNQNEMERVFKMFPSFHGTMYQKIKKLEARLV